MTASRPPRDDRGTRDLAPNNAVGAAYLLQCVAFTYGGFMLADSAGLFGWLSGQLLLAAAWLQWFVLLHETGHHTLFTNRSLNILASSAAYLVLIYAVGLSTLVGLTWLSVLISLVIQEIILLSQHTHIPAGNSGGAAVQPVAAIDQEKYTRSLRMPEWAARYLLMNFNLHELHHMFVRIPGYALHKISRRTMNEVDWLQWTLESRRMAGTAFLFSNRDQMGVPL